MQESPLSLIEQSFRHIAGDGCAGPALNAWPKRIESVVSGYYCYFFNVYFIFDKNLILFLYKYNNYVRNQPFFYAVEKGFSQIPRLPNSPRIYILSHCDSVRFSSPIARRQGMARRIIAAMVFPLLVFSAYSAAQTLDGSPYTPGKDPEYELYIGNWSGPVIRTTHGSLAERDILTRCDGDPMKPPRKGATLKYANRFVHAALGPGASTTPVALKGEQEIFYILSGKGAVKAGKKSADLYPGICILMPANLSFTMTNTGSEPLAMLMVNEPAPQGFRPNADMLVKDENTMPIESTNGHWCHIVKNFFETEAGLGTLERVLTVSLDPMTIAHPHSHGPGTEEVWTVVDGESLAWIGKKLYEQPAGVGYLIPPDGKTAHANMNTTEKPVKFFYFARYRDHDVRK